MHGIRRPGLIRVGIRGIRPPQSGETPYYSGNFWNQAPQGMQYMPADPYQGYQGYSRNQFPYYNNGYSWNQFPPLNSYS